MRRFTFLMGTVVVLAVVPATLTAQTAYKAPRGADGHADISGPWTNGSITKLERETRFGDRKAYTREEAAKIEGDTDDRNARQNKVTTKEEFANWKDNALKPDTSDECRSGSRGTACGYNAGWTDPGDRLARVNGEPRTSYVTFPANGRIPAPIAAAAGRVRRAPTEDEGEGADAGPARAGRGAPPAAAAGRGAPGRPAQNDNPEGRSLGERCIMSFGSSSGPIMQSQLYNNNYQFVQTKDNVAIVVEMVHDVRVVRIGGTHRTDGVRPYMGDSIGHWEGDTLVVETTNYHPSQNLRGSSANLKVTEKFTRTAPTRLLYQFKVEDPTTWAEPWGGEYEFARGQGVYEYACHEGNYGLQNILAGAREEEAVAKTAAR